MSRLRRFCGVEGTGLDHLRGIAASTDFRIGQGARMDVLHAGFAIDWVELVLRAEARRSRSKRGWREALARTFSPLCFWICKPGALPQAMIARAFSPHGVSGTEKRLYGAGTL